MVRWRSAVSRVLHIIVKAVADQALKALSRPELTRCTHSLGRPYSKAFPVSLQEDAVSGKLLRVLRLRPPLPVVSGQNCGAQLRTSTAFTKNRQGCWSTGMGLVNVARRL